MNTLTPKRPLIRKYTLPVRLGAKSWDHVQHALDLEVCYKVSYEDIYVRGKFLVQTLDKILSNSCIIFLYGSSDLGLDFQYLCEKWVSKRVERST